MVETEEAPKIGIPEDIAQVLDEVLETGWGKDVELYEVLDKTYVRSNTSLSLWLRIKEGRYCSPNLMRYEYPKILTFQVFSDGIIATLISLG